MQMQSIPVDWAALDEYLMRGAKAPVLDGGKLEALARAASQANTEEAVLAIPTVIEPELVRWAGMPF